MTQKGLPPIHPGEYLKEILEELEISQADLCLEIRFSAKYPLTTIPDTGIMG